MQVKIPAAVRHTFARTLREVTGAGSLLVIMAVIIGAGCAHKQPAIEVESQVVLDHFYRRAAVSLPLKAGLHMRKDGLAGMLMQGDVDVVLASAHTFYMAIRSPFGSPIKVLASDDRRVTLLDLTDGVQAYMGELNDATVERLIPISITPDELFAVLTQAVPDGWAESHIGQSGQAVYIKYIDGAQVAGGVPAPAARTIRLDRAGRIAEWQFFDPAGETVLTVEQHWENDGEALPAEWHIEVHDQKIGFSLTRTRLVAPVTGLPPTLFTPMIPAGVVISPL